jgi:hypothetical protein
MQNPEADTEWNDVLRAKGILPPRLDANGDLELTEEALEAMVDHAVAARQPSAADASLDEIDRLLENDMDDERLLESIRLQRMAELKALQGRSRFGSVEELEKRDFVRLVTDASRDIWVVLLLYKPG